MPSAPRCFDFLGEFDDFVRVVAAGAGEHGDLALGFFERDLDHAQMLFARERRAFARGAAGHQEVDPGVDLPAHQLPQRCFIQRAVSFETA